MIAIFLLNIVFYSSIQATSLLPSLLKFEQALRAVHASLKTTPQHSDSELLTFFEQLVHNATTFHTTIAPFPTTANRIAHIAQENIEIKKLIAQQAQQTYPFIHASVLRLINEFLAYKREYGTPLEKNLYKSMDNAAFIDRLLIKRPLMFMTAQDHYLLRNGMKGAKGFEDIGKNYEKAPLILADYLSYDEMQIAALLGVSVPTVFINNGARDNKAHPQKKGSFEPSGIYVGLVGARFEKKSYMEWQHIIITPYQNSSYHGYGNDPNPEYSRYPLLKMWARLYNVAYFFSYEEVLKDTSSRFIKIGPEIYFDTVIYKKRLALVIKPFLIDAHERAQKSNKRAYVHVVGLGLGVWQITAQQIPLMLEVYAEILKTTDLSSIADIDFSWFGPEYTQLDGVGNGQQFKTQHNTITIHFSKRNPADLLSGKDAGKLLIAQYAWDGNAYPGNEYWQGMLSASGDPAAACCSTIAELQNPLINPYVSAKYLHTL